MDRTSLAAIAGAKWVEELADLPREAPEYLGPMVVERLAMLRRIPPGPKAMLSDCEGVIVDVGPGEGASSMALAQLARRARVVGLEADLLHVRGAWPMCARYPSVRIGWGAVAGTLSNANVNAELGPVPVVSLGPSGCDVLFSWAGISRRGLYEASASWAPSVRQACILVVPEFWRKGLGSLPTPARQELREVCARGGVPEPSWEGISSLPGFSTFETWPTTDRLRARGWLIWLSGVFDGSPVSFMDVLHDRHSPEPRFQPTFEVPLEVVVATRP